MKILRNPSLNRKRRIN